MPICSRSPGVSARRYTPSSDVRFEPAYPGATPGPEATATAVRLVLACGAFHVDGTSLGVTWTTLIPGRLVQVSVAPAETPIPPHWQPLASW